MTIKEEAGGESIETFTIFNSSHMRRNALYALPTAGSSMLSHLVSLSISVDFRKSLFMCSR